MIAFGSCFPGRIVPIEIGPGKSWILQKRSFLAAESGVELSIHFNKKAKAGVFGGEGFIMQKLTGSGVAFAEIDGDLVEYELAAGQQMIVDTGNVAGFEETVSIDAQMVKGVKTSCLVARACSTPCSPVPVASGCRRCPFPILRQQWPR